MLGEGGHTQYEAAVASAKVDFNYIPGTVNRELMREFQRQYPEAFDTLGKLDIVRMIGSGGVPSLGSAMGIRDTHYRSAIPLRNGEPIFLMVHGVKMMVDAKGTGKVESQNGSLQVSSWHRRASSQLIGADMRGLNEEWEIDRTARMHEIVKSWGVRTYEFMVGVRLREVVAGDEPKPLATISRFSRGDDRGEAPGVLDVDSSPGIEFRAARSHTRIEQLIIWHKKGEPDLIREHVSHAIEGLQEESKLGLIDEDVQSPSALLIFLTRCAAENLGILHGKNTIHRFNHSGNTTIAGEAIDDGSILFLKQNEAENAQAPYVDLYAKYQEEALASNRISLSRQQWNEIQFMNDIGNEKDLLHDDSGYVGFTMAVGLLHALEYAYPEHTFPKYSEIKKTFFDHYLAAYVSVSGKDAGESPIIRHEDFNDYAKRYGH